MLSDPFLLVVVAVSAACAMVLVARWPAAGLTVLIPVLMWPQVLQLGALPVSQSVTAVLVAGLLIAGRKNQAPRWLIPSAVALSALLAASHVGHAMPHYMTPSGARNNMLTLVLNLWLVVAVAKARPAPLTILRGIGLGSLVFAYVVIAYGEEFAGRIAFRELNPNGVGHAAALGVIAIVGTAKLSRRRRWLLAAAAPLYLTYLAQSRGGLVVLIVGAVTGWVLNHQGRSRVIAVLVGGVAVGLLWGPAARFTQDILLAERNAAYVSTDASTEERKNVLKLAARLVGDQPFFGVGYAHFPDYAQSEIGMALNTHDDWVRIAVEAGVFALMLLGVIVASPLLRRLDAPLPPTQAVKALLAAGCASWLFANVTTDLRTALPVWLAAGLAWSLIVQHPPSLGNPINVPRAGLLHDVRSGGGAAGRAAVDRSDRGH